MKRQAAVSIFALAALCGASAAFAQSVQHPWYLEGDYGWSKHGMEGTDLDRAFATQGFTTSNSMDNKDQAWGLVLGYRFTPNWGIEGAYSDLGKFKYNGTVIAPAADTVSGDYQAKAWSLAGIGTLPLGNGFGLYGKLGLHDTKAELSATSGTGAGPTGGTSSGTGLLVGMGATYDFTPAVYGKLGWDRYMRVGDDQKTGRGDLDVFGAGVGFRF
ncbi:MAG: porin family protein [Burkholderiales bacterium]